MSYVNLILTEQDYRYLLPLALYEFYLRRDIYEGPYTKILLSTKIGRRFLVEQLFTDAEYPVPVEPKRSGSSKEDEFIIGDDEELRTYRFNIPGLDKMTLVLVLWYGRMFGKEHKDRLFESVYSHLRNVVEIIKTTISLEPVFKIIEVLIQDYGDRNGLRDKLLKTNKRLLTYLR